MTRPFKLRISYSRAEFEPWTMWCDGPFANGFSSEWCQFFSTYEEVLTMVRAVLDGEGPLEYLLVAEELADEIDRHRLGLLVDEVGGESW